MSLANSCVSRRGWFRSASSGARSSWWLMTPSIVHDNVHAVRSARNSGTRCKRRGAASRLPRAFSSGGAQSGRQGRGVPGRWGTGLELAQTLLDRRAARTRLGGGRLEVQAVAIQRVRIRLEAIEVVLKVGDARVVLREIAFQSCIFSGGRPPV